MTYYVLLHSGTGLIVTCPNVITNVMAVQNVTTNVMEVISAIINVMAAHNVIQVHSSHKIFQRNCVLWVFFKVSIDYINGGKFLMLVDRRSYI